MAGIYGVLTKDNGLNIQASDLFYSSSFDHVVTDDFKTDGLYYGRSSLNKFSNDRVVYENDQYIVVFEGLIYNEISTSVGEFIVEAYLDSKEKFAAKLKGQFCGFIYSKNDQDIFVFNDQLGTKPVYFHDSQDYFIFASELKVVTSLLDKIGIKKHLDYDAVYCMLTYGHMLDDVTYEKNTKKLKPFGLLHTGIDSALSISQYDKFNYKANEEITLDDAIAKIDSHLKASVNNCWSKDREYGYAHCSQLSGGLDSRVNLFVAKSLGFDDVTTITFSQSGSSDEKIAQNIATKESYKHVYYSLDNGLHLEKNLENYIGANDGLNNLIGSAAGYDFLQTINTQNFGSLHSGQIGDILFGSYVKADYKVEKNMVTDQHALLDRISFIDDFRSRYRNNPEQFAYEQRVPNCTLNGDRTISHIADIQSPFYDKQLIQLCLSLPWRLKKNEEIYLHWFNKYCTRVSQYEWESAGVKPKAIKFVRLAQIVKRYKNGAMRRLGFNINDMNPFDVWLRNNHRIMENVDRIYTQYISLIEDNGLRTVVKKMYNTDVKYSHYGRNNKFIVITLLMALKLHFPQGFGESKSSGQ